ncbi:MAG TPA: NAD-dependent epimerase/dehydratase family protein, partial [Bacillota bacterium]|nr:NAD-dependent epimerase/dehydratase family protein [Bacillota bacterium]
PILETKDFDASKVSGGYAKSKAEATKYVLGLTEKGLDAVVVHPTGVIGPYEYKLSHMGQLFVDFMKNRLFAIVNGAYDFVDVRDVAKGIMLAAKFGRKGENYILSGEHVTIKAMMQVLQDETGIKAPRRVIPTWFAYITGAFAELYYMAMRQKPLFTSYSVATLSGNSLTSCNKASKELGYSPRPFKETVKDTVAWLKKTVLKSG